MQQNEGNHKYSLALNEDCNDEEDSPLGFEDDPGCDEKNDSFLAKADACVSSTVQVPMVPKKMMFNPDSTLLESADCLTAHIPKDKVTRLSNVKNYSMSKANVVGDSQLCKGTYFKGNYVAKKPVDIGTIEVLSPKLKSAEYNVDVKLTSAVDNSTKRLSFNCISAKK